jgi:NAD-dependent dihydropyrimidine dehydrogenase PreA subunit
VLDFIEKLQVSEPVEGPSYLYFACTCGDQSGLTEKVFRKIMKEKGWPLSACFSVQMPETYIGMAGFKLDTEENARKKIEATDATLMRNIPRLKAKECFSEMTKGGAAWLKTYVVNPGFNRMAADDSKYLSTEACIHCSKCVEACPLKNVTLEEGRPKWNGNCTMCMSCYHHCPVNAIQYGKATVGKGQYYFKG